MSVIRSSRLLMSSTGLVSVGDGGRGGIRASWSICCCRVSVQWGSRGSRRLLVVSFSTGMGSSDRSSFSNVVGVGSICGVLASLATLNARSTACLSGESCVGVCGEPCCHDYDSSLGRFLSSFLLSLLYDTKANEYDTRNRM